MVWYMHIMQCTIALQWLHALKRNFISNMADMPDTGRPVRALRDA